MEKSLYPLTAISTLIHFLIIFFASKLNTYELGLYSLLITFYALAFLIAQFDGSYLCISKIIKISKYSQWNRSTNTLLFFILIITTSILLLNSYLITLSILLTTCLNNYSIWGIDMSTINERVLKRGDSEYRIKITTQIIFIRICVPILLLVILSFKNFSLYYLKIYILFILFLIFYFAFKKIGLIKIYGNNFTLPPIKYFFPLLLRKADNALFIFILGSIIGIEALGGIQLSISLSKSINLLTHQFLRVEFINFFSDRFIKKVLLSNSFTYLFYSIIPIFIFQITSKYGYENYLGTIFVLIILFLYHGNENTKLLMHSINISIKEYKINTFDRLFFISLKSLVLTLPIIIPNVNFSLNLVLALLIIPDLIFSIIRFIQLCNRLRL